MKEQSARDSWLGRNVGDVDLRDQASEVIIVGDTGEWQGPAGYLRWLELNGVNRHDSRLASLDIRITDTPNPSKPDQMKRIYVLPRRVYEDLVGDMDFALNYPDMV